MQPQYDEFISKFKSGEGCGSEEMLLLLATMGQGGTTLDPTSLIIGATLGKQGSGLGHLAPIILALTASASANANAQQGLGGPTGMPVAANPMNPLLLIALLGLGRDHGRGELKVMEKEVS